MKLVAIGMVKDEVDVVGRTVDHLLGQGVDEILLLENESTDGTWEILRDLRDAPQYAPGRLTIYADHEKGYFQSRKMTALAKDALERGADWIVPFDADEIWTAPGGLAAWLERVPADLGVVRFPNFNHYRTSRDPGGHPFDAMVYRWPQALSLPKVAFRPRPGVVVHAGNHDVSGVRGGWVLAPDARIHHYPYRSVEQFLSKARNGSEAYAATDLPRSTGQHWREWGDVLREHGEAGLRAWYQDAFYFDDPEGSGLVYDPPPYAD